MEGKMATKRVKCPNCKRCLFEITDKYDPNVTPNGSMVRSLAPYQIDWLCSKTTPVSEMTCPECLAPLAVKGRLIVVPPPFSMDDVLDRIHEDQQASLGPNVNEEAGKQTQAEEGDGAPAKVICPVCKREFKNAPALKGHMKAHSKK